MSQDERQGKVEKPYLPIGEEEAETGQTETVDKGGLPDPGSGNSHSIVGSGVEGAELSRRLAEAREKDLRRREQEQESPKIGDS